MRIWSQVTPEPLQGFSGATVTIGNFDGLHLGHQALLGRAQGLPGPRVVITFDPHPLQVLSPERALRRLLPREDLAEQLPRFGVDLLWVIPFTRGFAEMTAQEFLQGALAKPFQPRHIIAGYDFGFGKDRAGTLEILGQWAAQRECALHVVPVLNVEGQPVSSRRLRDLVTAGEVARAEALMGRPFFLRGPVVRGAGRGATLGIPTMNQAVVNETLPALGVYATRTRWAGRSLPSVTNVGVTPTFTDSAGAIKVETHVLDGTYEARGECIDVDFIQRLRAERKFSSVDDLKAQITLDMEQARAIHARVQVLS